MIFEIGCIFVIITLAIYYILYFKKNKVTNSKGQKKGLIQQSSSAVGVQPSSASFVMEHFPKLMMTFCGFVAFVILVLDYSFSLETSLLTVMIVIFGSILINKIRYRNLKKEDNEW